MFPSVLSQLLEEPALNPIKFILAMKEKLSFPQQLRLPMRLFVTSNKVTVRFISLAYPGGRTLMTAKFSGQSSALGFIMCASLMVEHLCKNEGKVVATRVLLVEDHEPFRRFVRATLSEHPDFCLVDEACDGLQAVHKFQELEPDLVLMDIGLPGQNGLLAARKMLALAPACKIVFLTQEGSPEIVEEALKLGAAGYVLKAHAAGELLPAMLAARDGQPFMSTVMARPHRPATARRRSGRGIRKAGSHDHAVRFHPDDASLLSTFTGFVEAELKAGNAVIMLLTESHRHAFLKSLQARGVDANLAVSSGRLALLDVDETLGKFIVDDLPDPDLFFQSAGEIVSAVKTANQDVRVVACGECAPTLWARGNGEAAVQLEQLWDRLVKMYDLETLCGYVRKDSSEQEKNVYEAICAAHSAVYAL